MRISNIRKLPICRSIYTANIVDHIGNELMLRPINVFSVRNYMCLFACRLVFAFILVNQRKTNEEELCCNYSWQLRNSYTTVYVYIYVFFCFFFL